MLWLCTAENRCLRNHGLPTNRCRYFDLMSRRLATLLSKCRFEVEICRRLPLRKKTFFSNAFLQLFHSLSFEEMSLKPFELEICHYGLGTAAMVAATAGTSQQTIARASTL